jgi:hypothetical protein
VRAYGDEELGADEREVYAALCRPGVSTREQVAAATGLAPATVDLALRSLLARFYIHALPSGEYVVR